MAIGATWDGCWSCASFPSIKGEYMPPHRLTHLNIVFQGCVYAPAVVVCKSGSPGEWAGCS